LADAFVVADDFVDDEPQEFLGEVGIEISFLGQLPQPLDLPFFSAGICGGQAGARLIFAHGLRDLEALGEHEHKGSIDIVDALAVTVQDFISHRNPSMPPASASDKRFSTFCTCARGCRLAGQAG
jgi:hypothetical protein